MSGTKMVRKQEIAEAVTRGACPLCTLIRHRQTQLVEENGIPNAERLCNYHGWSLARSAPAYFAAGIFLHALHVRIGASPQQEFQRCDFCEALREDEEEWLRLLVEKLKEPAFLDWMRIHGTLCLRHADRVKGHLGSEAQRTVTEILARTIEGLELGLSDYAKQAQRGAHDGGGVLGRAAEFLVSQRGIPGEEAPC